MEKIASFTIDHLRLIPGIYVSRKDADPVKGGVVTTFDLRMTAPNREPVINTAPLHAIEHLGATFLRNDEEWKDRVLYFGPMGCRTGFYLLLISFVVCSSSWLHSKARFPVLALRSAVTGTTPIWLALSGGLIATLPIPSPGLTSRTQFTLNCKREAVK